MPKIPTMKHTFQTKHTHSLLTHSTLIGKLNSWTANLDTNGFIVNFRIDSCSEINVLPKIIYNRLHQPPKLKSTAITLTANNNMNIPVLGECIASVTHKYVISPVMFGPVNQGCRIHRLHFCRGVRLPQ